MINHFKYLLLIIILSFSFSSAQLDTLWTKKFGGDFWDWGYGIVELDDGYVFSGIQYLGNTSDSSKAVFYKTDLNGEMIWHHTYGDTGLVFSGNLIMTHDGNLASLIYHNSFSINGIANLILIKMDFDGNVIFEKEYDVDLSPTYNLVNTSDGGYAFLSSGNLYKTDSDGEIIWTKDGLGSESIPIIESSDNGIVIVSQELNEKRLIKYNSDGVELWESDVAGDLSTVWNISETQNYYIGSADGGLLFWDSNGTYIGGMDMYNVGSWSRVWDVIEHYDGSYYFSGIAENQGSSAAIGNFTISNTNEYFEDNFSFNWTSYFGWGRTYDFIFNNDGGVSMIGGCQENVDDFNSYDICLFKLETAGPPPPPPPPPTLVINEFLALNGSCCTDNEGDNDDYIELFNYGNEEVNIAGLYITDDAGNQDSYFEIPSSDNNTVIQPGGFLTLWADNEEEQGSLHLGFKLNGTSEHIALYMSNKDSLIDDISYGNQDVDIAYGRYPDGGEEWGFMNPSPGTSNSEVLEINNESVISETFTIHQNYPNPFNPVTSLTYDLPEDGLVNITIYDMMGRIVKTLFKSSQTAGYKSIIWDATNDRNEPVPAGMYLYTIQAGEFRKTRKMVLLK